MIVHVALLVLGVVAGLSWGRAARREAWSQGLKSGWSIGWDSAVRTAKEKVGGES
jgi:hypothetical protein